MFVFVCYFWLFGVPIFLYKKYDQFIYIYIYIIYICFIIRLVFSSFALLARGKIHETHSGNSFFLAPEAASVGTFATCCFKICIESDCFMKGEYSTQGRSLIEMKKWNLVQLNRQRWGFQFWAKRSDKLDV